MATAITTKIRVNIKLDAGNGKTVSVSLGSLNKDAFDANKVLSIVGLLDSIFDKSIDSVEKIETSAIIE